LTHLLRGVRNYQEEQETAAFTKGSPKRSAEHSSTGLRKQPGVTPGPPVQLLCQC